MKQLLYFIALFFIISCSDSFEDCIATHVSICDNEVGPYCTFGFKFGPQASFNPAGLNVDGPGSAALGITFSFRTDEIKIDTEAGTDVQTFSFDDAPECRIDGVQSALREWSSFANLTFEQIENNANADIEFYIYDDESSRGTPNYQDGNCKAYGGRVMFTNNFLGDCNQFRILALHEIGHTLGLGHVDSDNIMTSSERKFQFDGLMLGDIQGIQSIYGQK